MAEREDERGRQSLWTSGGLVDAVVGSWLVSSLTQRLEKPLAAVPQSPTTILGAYIEFNTIS